jgi:hypothetical protein
MAKKNFSGSIKKTNIEGKSGISALFASAPISEESNTIPVEPVSQDTVPVVQKNKTHATFSLYLEDVEKLKDLIHFKKSGGEYWYSQSDALHDAINLLVAGMGNIPPRPDAVRNKRRGG